MMKASTKRALRTVFHMVLALIVVAPIVATALAGTPVEAQVALFVAVTGLVSKCVNALEDAGLLPAWLKDSNELP